MNDRENHEDDPLTFPARVPLELIDPAGDRARFDGIIRSITAGVAVERVQLRTAAGALGALGQLSGPAIAAAAAVLIAAGAALMLIPGPAASPPRSFAESAGIPHTLIELTMSAGAPTPDQLIGAINGTSR
ncbi:MAG TPA: hypothetical protein VGQ30_06395 [Gemmatimonadaceae bacterium]|jgi:hypothetical protein|nr:hypothetical protein [Gemmatimonadaceae bacterium]